VYVPAVDVSTEPDIDIDDVIFPSTSSVAVAPGSVKVSPTVRLMVEEPVNVITGGVVSAVELDVVEVLVVDPATTVIVPPNVKDEVALYQLTT
jgi:hypothetical protein